MSRKAQPTRRTNTQITSGNLLVTVIMPIYNVEAYLRDSIESVLNQSYENLEIFLVDDGSTDNSGRICDSFKKIDKRISVVHSPNYGVSNARNIGLSLGQGEYIAFIDSDDMVAKNYIENLMELAISNNADIVSCGVRSSSSCLDKCKNDFIDISDDPLIQLNSNSAILDLLYQRNIENSVWAKLYKFECIEDTIFDVNITIAEDLIFNYFAFKKANKVIRVQSPMYYYRVRKGSALHASFKPNRLSGLDALNSICEDTLYASQEQYAAAQNRLLIEASQLLTVIPRDEKKYLNTCYTYIKNTRIAALMDSQSKSKYRYYSVVSFLGVIPFRFILNLKTYIIRRIR